MTSVGVLKCVSLILLSAVLVQAQAASQEASDVTAVKGGSWLNHLHRSLGESSMGFTGRYGPSEPASIAPNSSPSPQQVTLSTRDVTLTGEDVYRLNCRGCHGESGLGAPPEIHSVINPVRATSVALTLQRMQLVGMPMSRAEAATLAGQARHALLDRLHNGGQNMPAFQHLRESEIRALLRYLEQLAGVPGTQKAALDVRETHLHRGEQIVKSTCHICHNAEGPNPDAQEMLYGSIPPLSSLTTRKSLPEFVEKVTHGAPVLMGAPAMWYRGRMPVFYYLSQDEAADVYLYLESYAPSQQTYVNYAATMGYDALLPPLRREPVHNRKPLILLVTGTLISMFLLAIGLGVTFREFRRLSRQTRKPITMPAAPVVPAKASTTSRAMTG